VYSWLTSTRLARRLADALLRRRARRRLLALDRASPRCQVHTLLGLVHRARGTRFGNDHDFRRLRTPDDFRRLVPLRSAAELWQQYGVPSLPELSGATWPGPIPYLATCDVAPGRASPPLPVSGELVATHREALWTALALVLGARPRARFLSGSLLFVGGGAALTPLRTGVATDNLEELTRAQLPRLLRPYITVAPYSGDASLQALAERGAALPVTCLAGSTRRLVRLFACLRERTGCQHLLDVWPGLSAVLYSRGPADPDRAELMRLAGTPSSEAPVLLMEACVRPEGVFALEDPRHGLLRMVPDHGIYFEFVALEDLGRPTPQRHGLGEVVPGVPYALVVTTPGLWACLTGLTVCFEKCDPPLLRSIEAGQPALPPVEILPLRAEAPLPHPGLPRPQSAGRAAAPARRFSRSPWSARADQK
jgi:hypothetical protein